MKKHKHKWFRRKISVSCCDLRPATVNWIIKDFDIYICKICNRVKNIN